MSAFDVYVFCLCMVVCVALSGTFSYLIARLYKLNVRLIRLGQEDEPIKIEYEKEAFCLKGFLFYAYFDGLPIIK